MHWGHWLWTKTHDGQQTIFQTRHRPDVAQCFFLLGPDNTRHLDLLLGAQFKVKLSSWESLYFSRLWRQSWTQMMMDETEWWGEHDGMKRSWDEVCISPYPGLTVCLSQLRKSLCSLQGRASSHPRQRRHLLGLLEFTPWLPYIQGSTHQDFPMLTLPPGSSSF